MSAITSRLSSAGLQLPVSPSGNPDESGLIVDAADREVATVDVNGELDDRRVAVITAALAEAINAGTVGRHAFCPHCGRDFDVDTVIETGGMLFDPRGDIVWHGEKLKLSASIRIVLGTLLKARGRTVSGEAILQRVDSEGQPKIVDVWICRLRAILTAGGHADPIATEWGRGFRWVA